MKILKAQINKLLNLLTEKEKLVLQCNLDEENSVYPFNNYEYILTILVWTNKISLKDYLKIRNDYIIRNKYLHLFEISAPRKFWEQWAEEHIKKIESNLVKPNKKLDPNYSWEYDLFYGNNKWNIKIEVKASRAVDANSKESLYKKALSSSSTKSFNMNFQQIKPDACDVFLWVAVWRDKVRYWVLSSNEVKNNKYYSKWQHRWNTWEWQLHMTNENIQEFAKYEVNSDQILEKIIQAKNR